MIQRLDSVTVNKIAAGEVVERPVSVVKELVENALDAGATDIRVTIKDSPSAFLEVADNGSGMSFDDLGRAFERHATSKIISIDDIWSLSSFGFRGEALPSIAAVSLCTCFSSNGKTEGGKIVFEGGIERLYEAASREQGTTVRVENLFYNIPARKKYLKSNDYEMRLIKEYIARQAFATAEKHIRFTLVKNNSTILAFTEHDTCIDRIAHYYGRDIADTLLSFEAEGHFFRLNGFISARQHTVSHAQNLVFFVNGRPIRDKRLSFTIKNALQGIFEPQEYPYAFLFITIDGDHVDVNVHPQKHEVRFAEDRSLYSAVYAAIRPLYTTVAAVGGVQFSPISDEVSEAGASYSAVSLFNEFGHQSEDVHDDTTTVLLKYRYFGVMFDRYCMFSNETELLLIDFHAINERILYDRFMTGDIKDFTAHIIPQAIHIGQRYVGMIEENSDLFERFGITMRVFGPETVIVETVPLIGKQQADPEKLLRGILEDTETESLKSPRAEIIAQRACKASLRTGDSVPESDAWFFLQTILDGKTALTCPHGRPVVKRLSANDINQWFKRV